MPSKKGKKPDINKISHNLIQCGIPNSFTKLAKRIWALNSEYTHPEKFEKKEPNITEVIYLLNLTWDTINYLLQKIEA